MSTENPTAFPTTQPLIDPVTRQRVLGVVGGLTSRDYFAAHADIPWNVVIETLRIKDGVPADEPFDVPIGKLMRARAELKYAEADAMLAERAKK